MATISTEQRAVVVVSDINDNSTVINKEKCQVIQRFNYDSCCKLNEAGKVYGPMEPTILSFRIRVNDPSHSDVFYSALATKARQNVSFLFNATYESDHLNGYEDGMVVNGYVTSVKQVYISGKNENGEGSLMMLDVEMLVCSVIYLGDERNITADFIK